MSVFFEAIFEEIQPRQISGFELDFADDLLGIVVAPHSDEESYEQGYGARKDHGSAFCDGGEEGEHREIEREEHSTDEHAENDEENGLKGC